MRRKSPLDLHGSRSIALTHARRSVCNLYVCCLNLSAVSLPAFLSVVFFFFSPSVRSFTSLIIYFVYSPSWDMSLLIPQGPARPTGGCGAVAVLVGPNAPLVVNMKTRASHACDVWDFFKPDMTSEYPRVRRASVPEHGCGCVYRRERKRERQEWYCCGSQLAAPSG